MGSKSSAHHVESARVPRGSAVRVFKDLARGQDVADVLNPVAESRGSGRAAWSPVGPATRALDAWQRELQGVSMSQGRSSAALKAPRWSIGLDGLQRSAARRGAALTQVRSVTSTIGAAVDETAAEIFVRLVDADAGRWRELDGAYCQISGLKSVLVAVDWQMAEVQAIWARALPERVGLVDVDQLDLHDHRGDAATPERRKLAGEWTAASLGLDALKETFDAVWSVFCAFVDEHGPLARLGAGGEVV